MTSHDERRGTPMTPRVTADRLHPELRRLFRFAPNPPVRRGWQRRLLRAATRLQRPPAPPPGIRSRVVDLGPGARVHVLAPAGERQRPALLWIHGGGMVIGSAAQDQALCLALARDLDIVVLSVDYRLAPEHPFPAPLDDCRAAWRWACSNAGDLGIDGRRIAIGGQSAGGGLAAGLVLRIHDEGGTQPVAQWLFCPMLDDRTAADRSLDGGRHYVWDNGSNRAGWTAYLGAPPGGPGVPAYAAPGRREDLRGLPPAWIGSGDIELFHAEDRRYAEGLAAAGVPCVLDTVPGAPHGFESVAPRTAVASAYLARARTWLGSQLGTAAPDAPGDAPEAPAYAPAGPPPRAPGIV